VWNVTVYGADGPQPTTEAMSTMRADARRAGAADLDAAAAVLADAFAEYAWTRWTVARDDHTDRVRRLQRLVMDRVALPHGEVWVAEDADGAIASVAIWMLPTTTVPATARREVELEQASLEGDRHEASVAAEAFVSQLRPTLPHYYLGAVGTRRDRQRRGFGAAVLDEVLARARTERIPVFLETSAPENVDFYAALGFTVVADVEVPGGGPPVWAMARGGRDY
jgi:GNAT superfamily N-acetyltransferase